MFEFTYKGFDYIAYERNDHKLIFFEAFKPNERTPFTELRESVSVIQYNEFTHSFFIVTNDSIKVIPHEFF